MGDRLWVVSPRFGGGGTETALAAELRPLADHFSLVFVCEAGQEPPVAGECFPLKVRGVGPLRFFSFYRQASALIARQRRAGDKVYSAGINCNCADLITAHISFADYAMALSDARKYGPDPRPRQRVNRWAWLHLLTRLERSLYHDSQVRLTAVSPRTARQLQARWHKPVAVTVAPPVPLADATDLEIASLRSRLAPSGRKLILGVGNDWHNKGFWFMTQLLSRLPRDTRPVFVVAGSENPDYGQRFLRRLGVAGDVRWLGQVGNMATLYRAVDLLVAPSFEDAFALPVREALQAGTPVLASDQVGAAEWYSLPTVPVGDLEAWRSALLRALDQTPQVRYCEPERDDPSLSVLLRGIE